MILLSFYQFFFQISDSAFKQQRLPAWQPILTAGTVLPTFFVIGIAFIPVGIGLLYFSDEVKELTTDYTNCISNNTKRDFGEMCTKVIQKDPSLECFCEVEIKLPTDFFGNVYMYYGLTNFYQNHRRYVKSRDDNQLLGEIDDIVSNDCHPFAYEEVGGKPIVPCGAIANSLFSDELSLRREKDKKTDSPKIVPLLRTGIAWPSDKRIKFRNPEGNLSEILKDYPKPKNWNKTIYQLDLENEDNNGFQNEDLIVWMRTAALPTFRKLYRRIDHSEAGFRDGLPEGNYTLIVKYCKSRFADILDSLI